MTARDDDSDPIWKALADPTRRAILDELAVESRTTGELVERFAPLCRTNVMKHLEVLVEANLVIVRRDGRTRWNYLNAAPIQHVCDRWVGAHVKRMAKSLAQLKRHLERQEVDAKEVGRRKADRMKNDLKSPSRLARRARARTKRKRLDTREDSTCQRS